MKMVREVSIFYCTCPRVCDCADPKNGLMSEECPVHNDDPYQSDDCPVHGLTMAESYQPALFYPEHPLTHILEALGIEPHEGEMIFIGRSDSLGNSPIRRYEIGALNP